MAFAMKELLDKVLEERARETGQLRELVQTAEARDDGWTGEDKQEFERRSAALTELDTRIKTLNDMVVGEKSADEYRASLEKMLPTGDDAAPTGDPRVDQERRLADFFAGKEGTPKAMDISFKGLKVEREGHRNVVRDTESRALSVGTTTAGGYTFEPSFRQMLYEHLIFSSAIRQTRATVLTTASGENLLLPKTTAHPAAGTIVAEGGLINENDPAFSQGTITSYKYANLVSISTELDTDTQVDLLGYVARQMGVALGNGSGAHFVTGTGTSQPQGVLVGAGTVAQVLGTSGTASAGATFADLVSVFDKIIPPYQRNGEWFMSQTARSKIRSLVTTQGQPIFLPALAPGMPDTLFGYPVIVDPNMPAVGTSGTSIAWGDFSTYFIRDVAGVRIERSQDYLFGNDQVAYRAILRTGGVLLDTTGAIATYKGGTA